MQTSPFVFFTTVQCSRDRVISHLQLLQGEPPTSTDATVILEGRTSDDGPQHINGPRRNGGDLGKTSISATVLAAWLYSHNNQIVSSHISTNNDLQEAVYEIGRRQDIEFQDIYLLPTWSKWVRTRRCQSLRKWLLGICCIHEIRSALLYL